MTIIRRSILLLGTVALVYFFSPALSSDVIETRQPLVEARVRSPLAQGITQIEERIAQVFGGVANMALSVVALPPQDEGERVNLPYKPTSLDIDTESEVEMLELINAERKLAGVGPLLLDENIVPVARIHSSDMWQRQYFAHVNLDGENPVDRMLEGGVEFAYAGENLALARNVERAHIGLMNSPGHKRNILDPDFKRVGIGVIDGGAYGKMFTQNFAD